MPLLTVVIPTHNRSDILEQCLRCLEQQTIADELEVIVVNDVPDDNGIERLANAAWQIPIHFETIPPCHQGAARNHGVQKARASTVLFIGDDILLHPECCRVHVEAQENASIPVAVLGYTEWDPACGITPVMEWLTQSGWQFGYEQIAPYAEGAIPKDIQHRFTYTSLISIPRELAARFPFREDVSLYGWEDTVWGNALRSAGVRLMYAPEAKALHHHHMEEADSLRRMETLGESAVHLARLDSTFDRLPTGFKYIAYHIFALLPTMAGKHRAAFLRGIKRAKAILNC